MHETHNLKKWRDNWKVSLLPDSIFAAKPKNFVMKPNVSLLAVLVTAFMMTSASCSCPRHSDSFHVVPCPSSIHVGEGSFRFTPFTVISVSSQEQKDAAEWFAWIFARPAGFVPMVLMNQDDADVILTYDTTLAPEAYRIKVSRSRITVAASAETGFFYAFQTLRQALPDSINSLKHVDDAQWSIPVMEICDAPVFAHRCVKIDMTAGLIPIGELLEFVEYISMLKLNYIHISGHELYPSDEFASLVEFASSMHVNILPDDGKCAELYSCPKAIALQMFASVAALAEVAWSDREVEDRMGFNETMESINDYMAQRQLACSRSVFDVGLASLR